MLSVSNKIHSSSYLRRHWHLLRTAGIRDNGRNV